MGFYSFYRIIKDVVKSLFGSKGWKILLIAVIVLIILFNCTSVFASFDVYYEHGGINVTLPDIPVDMPTNHYILRRDDYWKAYGLWVANEWNYDSTFYMEGQYIHVNGNFSLYRCYDSNMNSWVKVSSNEYINTSPSIDTVLLTTDNIFGSDGSVLVEATLLSKFVAPSILNDDEEILKWNFDYLKVGLGDCSINDDIELHFNYCSSDKIFWLNEEKTDYTLTSRVESKVLLNRSSKYNDVSSSYYKIPKTDILSGRTIRKGDVIYFTIHYKDREGNDKVVTTKDYFICERTSEDIQDEHHSQTIGAINDQTDAIKGQTDAIKESSDKIFSDEYDESKIDISTEASDSVDGSSITNFVTTILQNIQNIATGDWNSVNTISIPLGFVDEDIEFSSDLLSSHLPGALKTLINVFWMYLFGMYIFRYTSKLIDWLKSGDILNNKEMGANEVITSSML